MSDPASEPAPCGDDAAGEAAAAAAVDEIVRFNAHRDPALVAIKYERMDVGPFAFFRGADHLFAQAWSTIKPSDVGPAVLICGDLHLENFGGFRSEDGVFRFDINDFDEALIAPCSFDLVRCATSTLLAAEEWQLSAVPATKILWSFLASYRRALVAAAESGKPGEVTHDNASGPIARLLGATALATQAALLDENTEKKGGVRRIVRSARRHPDASPQWTKLIGDAVEQYGRAQGQAEAFEVLDVARRIAGIGSLGVARYTVLVSGGGAAKENRLLDVKEQPPSSVLACAAGAQLDYGGNEALRVVDAQRRLQASPTAGLAALSIEGRWFRMREMIPEENRSRLDRLAHQPDELQAAVNLAGQTTAWSQWRGAVAAQRPPAELAAWAEGPGLEAVIPAAIRAAAQTMRGYRAFHAAHKKGLA